MERVIVGEMTYIMSSEKVHMLEMGCVPNNLKYLGNIVEKLGHNWYRVYFKTDEDFLRKTLIEQVVKDLDTKFPIPEVTTFGEFNRNRKIKSPSCGVLRPEECMIKEKPKKAPTETKGYEDLTRILDGALQQATSGKGKERHAGNKPFDKQPIMEIARMTGLAYQTGQAMKKIQESHTLLEIKGKEAAISELRGAIIYLAAAIKTIEEQKNA